jgi:hypothetical protein
MHESDPQQDPKTTPAAIQLTPGIWIMIAILGVLAIVPFAAMALALKKSGYLPGPAPTASGTPRGKTNDPIMDLTGLRPSAEQAAEKNLPIPKLADPVVPKESLQLGSQTRSQ